MKAIALTIAALVSFCIGAGASNARWHAGDFCAATEQKAAEGSRPQTAQIVAFGPPAFREQAFYAGCEERSAAAHAKTLAAAVTEPQPEPRDSDALLPGAPGGLAAGKRAAEGAAQVKIYGFVRTYCALDTRESVAGTEDFFYYMPKDESVSAAGEDLNAQMSMRFAALTSRIGINVTDYEFGGLKMGAKIETDFYNGLSGVTGTATLRLRQAYATIGRGGWTLTAGQAWHPLADDKPDVFSLNTGAPFGPFSRTPQFKLDLGLTGPFSLTAAALWQMQYTSSGPAGASANYIKYGCTPEIYAGLNYSAAGLLLRFGADILSIKPRTSDGSVKVSDRITTVSPFAYAQYKRGPFTFKAKTVFAQAGEHLNLNGGYGITGTMSDGASYRYAPTRNSSSWVSLMYGGQTQWILFGGYVRNFGTRDELYGAQNGYAPAANLYFSKNSFSNMNRMWRLTPTVIRNIGKFSLGFEYEITSVQYGSYKTVDGVKMIGSYSLARDNLHWITNHRLQALVKFAF